MSLLLSRFAKTAVCSILAGVLLFLGSGGGFGQDPGPPVVGFIDVFPTVGEADGVVVFTVALSGPSTETITVQYAMVNDTATFPSDYEPISGETTSGTLIFAPGETVKQIQVKIINDAAAEDTESFTIVLSNPVNTVLGSQPAVVTIIDDDGPLPTVQFASANYSVSESAGTAVIEVTLSAEPLQPVTVKYALTGGTATSGTDYTLIGNTLTFAAKTVMTPGEMSKTITVAIVNDMEMEDDETVEFTLSAPSGASLGTPPTTTLTIMDDDVLPPVVDMEINAPGTDDDFVFLTPSDATEIIYAMCYAKLKEPAPADLTVSITNEAGGGDFYFSTLLGTENSSSVSLTLPMTGAPVPFKISGQTVSNSMGDAVILAQSAGQDVGKKEGAVVKVEITFKYKSTQNVKGEVDNTDATGDNAVRDYYKKIRGTYNLGPGVFLLPFNKRANLWGTLAIGKVTPPTFDKKISMRRNAQVRFYVRKNRNKAEWDGSKDFPPPGNNSGNDTSPLEFKDEDPQASTPKSSSSKGHVYDIAVPGVLTDDLAPTKSEIKSMRGNYVAFATYDEKPVSNSLKWHTKQSYTITNVKNQDLWLTDNSINGDNDTKDGSHVLLSYRLGSPVIKKTNPKSLETTDLFDLISINGKNFVAGFTVVFKKDGKTGGTVTTSKVGFDTALSEIFLERPASRSVET